VDIACAVYSHDTCGTGAGRATKGTSKAEAETTRKVREALQLSGSLRVTTRHIFLLSGVLFQVRTKRHAVG
jgi:hypothetical protein